MRINKERKIMARVIKVIWTSKGIDYTAIKIDDGDIYNSIQSLSDLIKTESDNLIKEGFMITSLIAGPKCIRILNAMGGIQYCYWDDMMFPLLQTDRRLEDVIYLLYRKVGVNLIEASEFAELEVLP